MAKSVRNNDQRVLDVLTSLRGIRRTAYSTKQISKVKSSKLVERFGP
jgi:hypothetical protein